MVFMPCLTYTTEIYGIGLGMATPASESFPAKIEMFLSDSTIEIPCKIREQ